MEEKREQISTLEKERQSIYNRNRHKKSGELNTEARAISAKIKPLREELSLAKAVAEKIPKRKKCSKLNGRRKPLFLRRIRKEGMHDDKYNINRNTAEEKGGKYPDRQAPHL